jgi:integrase
MPAEIKALVTCLGVRERTLVLLAASTGLRQSEVFGLKWEDIDFDQRAMSVTRSSFMESLERARLNHHKSPYPSIQLSHRLCLIGKNVLRTRNPMIGSLPAGGAGEEGRTGDKRSYANTFVLWRYTSEFRNDSDGIRSATLNRLSFEVSEPSSK